MGRIDLRKSHASGHSMVAWCGARSAKMVEALNYMNKVELKFDHINGNICSYEPLYECQLASLLAFSFQFS
ncbi:hypothetical protein C5167_003912 [Papaver somniferum]|nr:hypothetical protein C5167_003912 [Papaver somniferum]